MLNAIVVLEDNKNRRELNLKYKMVDDMPITKVSFENLGNGIFYSFRQVYKSLGAEVELVINADKVVEIKTI
ncbi:hypothetical protein X915_gp126 [Bacillus phage vB_BanS-Tsamsa]|uniref:Uncharacterized protein n=1 Tax=Bacillus phage vB_BanS-Tsamsa TaxID=1308863 RepID=U5J9K6_9CAUD|nr:hypothetical protein X915_gp126 [Bacillus phage vB_BanS-Tsamsa]AGI11928.1 hypothetical protein [Bacillus phage vB_BanS-Tsamsa]